MVEIHAIITHVSMSFLETLEMIWIVLFKTFFVKDFGAFGRLLGVLIKLYFIAGV
jgi:hypothetical protein